MKSARGYLLMASGHGPELRKVVNVRREQSCRGWKSKSPQKGRSPHPLLPSYCLLAVRGLDAGASGAALGDGNDPVSTVADPGV